VRETQKYVVGLTTIDYRVLLIIVLKPLIEDLRIKIIDKFYVK